MGELMPNGVSSNVRAGVPIVVTEGRGGELFDVDGNRYIDYMVGFGAAMLGHGHRAVTEAVQKVVGRGASFALSTELEGRLCEKIIDLCPSVEMVRLCNSGTDAGVTAHRIALAWTGRTRVVRIQGDYNGGHDPFMFDITGQDPRGFGAPTAASRGLLPGVGEHVVTVPFNDLSAIASAFETADGGIAAVFLEPVLGNAAAIMPLPGYLEGVRALCTRHGALLVFDEVKTGFRVHPGGAQALFGVEPDLTMLGKAMGNGLPIAAIGGKRRYMELLCLGGVHHCGTYYGNLVCVAAANAVLDLLPELDYQGTMRRGESLARELCRVIHTELGVSARWQGVGTMFGITLGERSPADYTEWWNNTDHRQWEAVALLMRDMGVLTDAMIGLWFVTFAHTDAHLEETLEICRQALRRHAGSRR